MAENMIKPNIRLLAENYVPAAKRFERTSTRIESMETDIELLKKVLQDHSEKINHIA